MTQAAAKPQFNFSERTKYDALMDVLEIGSRHALSIPVMSCRMSTMT